MNGTTDNRAQIGTRIDLILFASFGGAHTQIIELRANSIYNLVLSKQIQIHSFIELFNRVMVIRRLARPHTMSATQQMN